jgi:hypothetical protein
VIAISARVRDGGRWGDCEFRARSIASGLRTAARKLGLRGPILIRHRVGESQWAVNVDGRMMIVIAKEAS